jgi:hypothetical protein
MFRKFLIVAFLAVFGNVKAIIEEFQAHDPQEFHKAAMDKFLEVRRKDPTQNLSSDGELMKLANKHAIVRLRRKPDEALSLRKADMIGAPEGQKSEIMLELPSPVADEDKFLQAAVSQQTTFSGQVMLPQEARAMGVAFIEDIGLGAISKAGALPLGTEGEWLSFAEKKLKQEESLDYQALLWELGSEIIERNQRERGIMNLTHEMNLVKNMEAWFYKGGGKIHFSKPTVSIEEGFQMITNEDVNEYDAVITAPLQLIMCRQTARNVVIPNRGKYLGDELQKTFDKNELWGMVVFVLHEYYKEVNGKGSKWGPFLRTLRMRFLSTPVVHQIQGTIALRMNNKWLKDSDDFMWWAVGADGPCSPTTGICKTKPEERIGDTRFNTHQIRWAYWVVKQNSVRIKQIATGLEFIALIPFYNFVEKKLGVGGGITFDLDGTVSVRAGKHQEEGLPVVLSPGNLTDSEFFLRYLRLPEERNEHTEVKLSLPGVIPKGSKFHYCIKGTFREQNKDECKASYRSDAMFWKSKVLTEWRKTMNLPPRMQELRMWANRLHIYGGEEEQKLISQANAVIAGLPLPVDQVSAEDQLMMLGIAKDNLQAALIASGPQGDRPAPQLYTAPDPTEDPEADRAMQNLATLALQAQKTVYTGNLMLNATQVVLNRTKDFFQHGVLPMAGLDELDNFLLKKIGMLAHCGFENDMKIVYGNVSEELMCAMRVHLMNESEIFVFCPKEARVWEDNCMDVSFMNYTAISERNEMDVVQALRVSIQGLLASYPTSMEEDAALIQQAVASQEARKRFTSTSNTGSAADGGSGESEAGGDEIDTTDAEEEVDLIDQEVDPSDQNNKKNKNDKKAQEEEEESVGPVTLAAYRLRFREKEILHSALQYLDEHEAKILNGSVVFQIEMKAQERLEADIRAAEHARFIEEVKQRAAIKVDLVSTVEVDLGESMGGKRNLTLREGEDLTRVVQSFVREHQITPSYVATLEQALRSRVVAPVPLQLMLGVVTPPGERHVLAVPEGANATVDTGVFCAKYDTPSDQVLDTPWCQALLQRVRERIAPTTFTRKVLLVVPIDAPDTRKLKLVIREGEQHDLMQFVSDFFEVYRMPAESISMMAQEVHKRLPNIALQIPVGLSAQRQVAIRFSLHDNITNVVEGFTNFYELDESVKVQILKRAKHGMAPGTFMV